MLTINISIPDSEIITPKDIKQVIELNRYIVEKEGEIYQELEDDDRRILNKIFEGMNFRDNIHDKRYRLAKKATRILAGISHSQPFHNGNKRTSLALTIKYLRRNGFDLPINRIRDRQEVYNLLVKTADKFTGDPTIFSEVEEFLTERIKLYQNYFISDGSSLSSAW